MVTYTKSIILKNKINRRVFFIAKIKKRVLKMGRKKKLFTGVKPIGGHQIKSRRLARKITSEFHSISNQVSLINALPNLNLFDKEKNIEELESKLTDIGGLNRYQQASIISTSFFKTSKWISQTLVELGLKENNTSKKLNVLEVGAINIQLHKYNWLSVRSIDLFSQHPLIEECDFFTVEPKEEFDVVVCSMVFAFFIYIFYL
jgi:25S rRNA (adenine2142-N1)-methyltransferase